MHPRLYILSGASGCGKTTLLNDIAAVNESGIDPALRAVRAPKYSERHVRANAAEPDDVTHIDRIDSSNVDIAYVINNNRYGIRLAPIQRLIDAGLNPFIILSDFRVVRQLKDRLGSLAVAIYISSTVDAAKLRRIQKERLGFRPTAEQKSVLSYHFARASAAARLGWWDRVSDCVAELENDWHSYATDARSTEIRAQRIRAFHIRYIEHLHMFDHVILNYTENRPEEMREQARSLLENIDSFSQFRHKEFPPLFVVAAASGAGKATLMETLNLIGRDAVRVTSKLAKRSPRDGDKRDGMIAINRPFGAVKPEWPDWWTDSMREFAQKGDFPDEYDLRWEFHKRPGASGTGTEYAVSSREIQKGIDEGRAQIFVSNTDQFSRFRDRWPANATFVYLHRLVSAQDNREFQVRKWTGDPNEAEVRIAEREAVHRAYIERISEFDHVLLNTEFQEDLYDQMFSLLEFHSRR